MNLDSPYTWYVIASYVMWGGFIAVLVIQAICRYRQTKNMQE